MVQLADQSPESRGFQHFIDGAWEASTSGSVRKATSPATGDVIAELPEGNREDAKRAIEAANQAKSNLSSLTVYERAELCESMAAEVGTAKEDLARWLVVDQGKPMDEARGEIDHVIDTFHRAGEVSKHFTGEIIESTDPDKRILTIRKPHGVVGIITPWNFPIGTVIDYLAYAIATGNTVVWVPAPSTSAVCARFVELLAESEIPDGALNLVIGEGAVVGDEIVKNTGTDAICFTGSSRTGELIATNAGAKPRILELGGNGPVIVMDDADIDDAIECTAGGCFSNAGQICTASERILVHEDIYDTFIEKLIAHAEDVQLGDPFDPDTDMGPLNNEEVANKMDRHVKDALDKGATIQTGGKRKEGMPTDKYYLPTVITDVTRDMEVNQEESFGPIAPVLVFENREEAVEIANANRYGLSMGVFTDSINNMDYYLKNLESGMININDTSAHWESQTPAGGFTGKDSGHGRYGGRFSVDELTQIINITIGT